MLPLLTGVLVLGDRVGSLDDPEVALRVVRADRAQELVDTVAFGRAGEDPRHEAAQRRGLGARGCRFGHPGTSSVRFVAIIRSEEHTSELQSLMRISYAVFC